MGEEIARIRKQKCLSERLVELREELWSARVAPANSVSRPLVNLPRDLVKRTTIFLSQESWSEAVRIIPLNDGIKLSKTLNQDGKNVAV